MSGREGRENKARREGGRGGNLTFNATLDLERRSIAHAMCPTFVFFQEDVE